VSEDPVRSALHDLAEMFGRSGQEDGIRDPTPHSTVTRCHQDAAQPQVK